MFENVNLNQIFQYLLVSLAFLAPLTVFGANLVIVVITLLWLLSGNYKSKFKQIFDSKLMIASVVFFGLHIIGLAWTSNIAWGLHIIHKMWYFILFFPVLFNLVEKKYIKYYISAFLLAILLTEVLSYLIFFNVIPAFKYATVYDPTPFMSHISYNPILAFAIYLVCHQIFLNRDLSQVKLILYSLVAISMTINMFITGGRAGYVMYFAMLGILFLQLLQSKRYKSVLFILILIPGIFYSAYIFSDIFHNRVHETINSIIAYTPDMADALAHRVTFAVNTFGIIVNHPLLGVGTGDFPDVYASINRTASPGVPNTSNPHNMYLLIQAQLGIFGLISLLSIFYYQIKLSFLSSDRFIRDVGITLPLLFLLAMFSDSYLLGHYTSLIFVFFSSFLHKDFEKS